MRGHPLGVFCQLRSYPAVAKSFRRDKGECRLQFSIHFILVSFTILVQLRFGQVHKEHTHRPNHAFVDDKAGLGLAPPCAEILGLGEAVQIRIAIANMFAHSGHYAAGDNAIRQS